jgi:hypothetical protein
LSGEDKALVGAAGEHLVLSRLLSRQLLAAQAPRGTRKVDIIVNYIDGGNPKLVQVKTTMGSTKQGWWMGEKHETITDDDLFYCFVDFGVKDGAVYVMPASVVAETIAADHATWMATPGKNGQAHGETTGRRMRAKTFTKPEGWMDEYFEAWHLLK